MPQYGTPAEMRIETSPRTRILLIWKSPVFHFIHSKNICVSVPTGTSINLSVRSADTFSSSVDDVSPATVVLESTTMTCHTQTVADFLQLINMKLMEG